MLKKMILIITIFLFILSWINVYALDNSVDVSKYNNDYRNVFLYDKGHFKDNTYLNTKPIANLSIKYNGQTYSDGATFTAFYGDTITLQDLSTSPSGVGIGELDFQ